MLAEHPEPVAEPDEEPLRRFGIFRAAFCRHGWRHWAITAELFLVAIAVVAIVNVFGGQP